MQILQFIFFGVILAYTSVSQAFQFQWFGPLAGTDSYDYTPSWIADTTVGYDRIWWCGNDPDDGAGDVIWYKDNINPTPQVVMRPTEPWEGIYVCDPSVVYGQFNPPGMNKTYSMAMYYTATDDNGVNNKVGVAFSNNGINWDKYPNNPIITPKVSNSGFYGSGETQARNTDGISNIQLWYFDNSDGTENVYERTSSDGVNFGSPTALSKNGLPSSARIGGSGIALSPSQPYELYWIFAEFVGVNPGGKLGLWKISFGNRFSGTWTFLDYIYPASVGENVIFEPGFRTDIYGNITPVSWPAIWVGFGCGDGWINQANTWDLCQAGGQ
ncbi:MAG: hypothetical protein JXR29_09670 [Methylothermaceae bacterium]|nr:hypothetical protein [Methylothermaceae bacterium]